MLSHLNPIAKIVIVVAFTVAAVWTLNLATLVDLIVLQLIFIPFLGLRAKVILVRVFPLLVVAAVLVLTNALFSGLVPDDPNAWAWSWGPFGLSEAAIAGALPIGLRVLVLSIPAVLILGSTDPIDLSDSLNQHWRVPSRYTLAMVVGLQLIPQLRRDWIETSMALRARGMSAWNPLAAPGMAASRLVNLLVLALRRATRSAMAMTARGYDPYEPRTLARASTITWIDYFAMLVVVVLVVAIVILSSGMTFT